MSRRSPHLLRVEVSPGCFAALIGAARTAGLRVGWLDLAAAAPLPADLEAAAVAGVLRAVSAGEGRSVAIKPLRGTPVLRDLLREHFAGCALVLVRGVISAPLLAPAGKDWRIAGDQDQRVSTADLVAALPRPKPPALAASRLRGGSPGLLQPPVPPPDPV